MALNKNRPSTLVVYLEGDVAKSDKWFGVCRDKQANQSADSVSKPKQSRQKAPPRKRWGVFFIGTTEAN
jgi:hypothetical protein